MSYFDAKYLRSQLTLLGKTAEEFAHDLGVSSVTVSRWLNHHHVPNKLTQLAIFNLLETYHRKAAECPPLKP